MPHDGAPADDGKNRSAIRRPDNIGEMYEWVIGPVLKAVEEYKASLAKHPNPPAANMTRF